jgi:hypothetical protein
VVDPAEAVKERGSDMEKGSKVRETGKGDVAKALVLEDFTRIVGSQLWVLYVTSRRKQ